MKLEGQNIIIVSNEPWGDIWYSKHNYAYELSKKNNIIFIDPPQPFKFSTLFHFKIQERKISQSLSVIQYPNIFPVSLPGFWKLNDRFILKKLKKHFNSKKIRDIVFWSFDPIRLYKPKLLKPLVTISHIVDAYIFSFKSEELIAKDADLIICVSDEIAKNYKKYNSNVITINHAIPDDEFLPISVNRNTPLKGLFIGKIDLRIDFEFTLEVFRSFPNIQFTIIGLVDASFKKRVENEKIKNVTYITPIKSEELRKYISESDFCFIFKKIYSGNNISSHKLLQYLAQGKPIFGTEFSDVEADIKNTLYLSNIVSEIKKLLKGFSENGESPEKTTIRINYAKQHTFSRAINTIESALQLKPPSNRYVYYSQMSGKTRTLNFFRRAFTVSLIDSFFSLLMHKLRFTRPLVSKMIAPEYLYKNPAWRSYSKNGIKMKLNVSNLVDHCVYFANEQKAIDKFISHLKPTDTVIDIGANIGFTTLLFSKSCPNGNIISFEPSGELFNTALGHIQLNGIKNATILNIGLGEHEKTVQLYKVSENNSGMNRVFEQENTSFNSESITIKTLDDIVSERKIDKVNAIKIDVEGYEFKILKGAYNTLKKTTPILLIEIDDYNLKEQQSSPKELFKFLIDLGYTIFAADSMNKIDLQHDYTGVHFDVICFHKTN